MVTNRLPIPEGKVLKLILVGYRPTSTDVKLLVTVAYTFVGDVTFYTGQVLIHRTLCLESDLAT